MPRLVHPWYLMFAGIALFNAVRACFEDVFIDESESAPSELAREERGLKATKVTRPLVIGLFLLIALFGIRKAFRP